MSVDSIARKWRDILLSSQPVDRPRAETVLAEVYRLAGLPPPAHFYWCQSPLEAAWATLAVIGETDGFNQAVIQEIGRRTDGREKIDAAVSAAAGKLEIEPPEVGGFFGKPFYNASGRNSLTKALNRQGLWAWSARAYTGRTWNLGAAGPFRELDEIELLLFRDDDKGLVSQALARAGPKPLGVLALRSAFHGLYGNHAIGEVARNEALAEQGVEGGPGLLHPAIWEAYETCGMWWPLTTGIVLSERPSSVTGSAAGVTMKWSDDFTVGDLGTGSSLVRRSIEPTGDTRPLTSRVFDEILPRDHAARILRLRQHSPLPLFDRYCAGEHEQVWRELVSLGNAIRTDPIAADALAIAFETMERVAANIRLLVERLTGLGFQFRAPTSRSWLSKLMASDHCPHRPPAGDVSAKIAQLETELGGPIPLSLRAFFEVVGEVNFVGRHPTISPNKVGIYPDALAVCGVADARAAADHFDDESGDGLSHFIILAPDSLHKENISGGDPYGVSVPTLSADAPFEGEHHDVNFVEYLRLAIAWGGFPGWEREAPQPDLLTELHRDLISF